MKLSSGLDKINFVWYNKGTLNEYSYYNKRREEAKCRSGREAKFMRNYFQCTECGQIHYIDMEYKIDQDDIYDMLYCSKCETETKQLWCGNNIENYYELYDPFQDERFFIYD